MMEQPLYHETSSDFYRQLPAKTCSHCGKEMDEQCESYKTECDECAVTEH
ncbi:protein YhfH [Exiguobacterium sp.]|nr:protein YhfH [Exiguobacterium sp.]